MTVGTAFLAVHDDGCLPKRNCISRRMCSSIWSLSLHLHSLHRHWRRRRSSGANTSPVSRRSLRKWPASFQRTLCQTLRAFWWAASRSPPPPYVDCCTRFGARSAYFSSNKTRNWPTCSSEGGSCFGLRNKCIMGCPENKSKCLYGKNICTYNIISCPLEVSPRVLP